jgi:DNA-directed RNA polymerase beta' subunit
VCKQIDILLLTILNILSYTLLSLQQPSHMRMNILSKKENYSEEEETVQGSPLVDKPYYVDTLAYKVDNSEQWLFDY